MIVNSTQLTRAAATIRERNTGPQALSCGTVVSDAQLDTAAGILRDADPTVCNGDVRERPGFIEPERQENPEVLVFQMGILPGEMHRIARDGRLLPTTVTA